MINLLYAVNTKNVLTALNYYGELKKQY